MEAKVIPDPPVPLDCDLTDFPFMPLYIARLKQSKAWAFCRRKPELAFYLINLWSAAWHGKPAASLEDDDMTLADAAQCDGKTWTKLRDQIMRGWIKCSDGRFYHPTVAAMANESWAGRQGYRERLAKARAAKAQRQSQDNHNSIIEPVIEPVTEPVTPPVIALKGQGQGEGEGEREVSSPLTPEQSGANGASRFSGLGGVTPCPETGRPVVGRYYLDDAAKLVCDAASINEATWRGDWRPLIEWLTAGIDLADVILPTVRAVAARPGYTPKSTLAYFTVPVREAHARKSP